MAATKFYLSNYFLYEIFKMKFHSIIIKIPTTLSEVSSTTLPVLHG